MKLLSIRLLGPVEVTRDGVVLPIGGRLPRAAVALLALSAGTPVPAQTLIDALWGEDAPMAVRSSLAAHLSRLRATGLGTALVHRDGGYVLDVPTDQVDLHRAVRLHAEGRAMLAVEPLQALSSLDAALRCWRGTPFSGLDDMPFLPGARRKCRDRHAAIQRDRFDALQAAGRGAEIVEELDDLARRHPVTERVWQQLMTALYTSGRRPESLQAYTVLVDNLRTRLGLDPSQATMALHQAILRGELDPSRPRRGPSGSAPPPTPRSAVISPFVGRSDELESLRRHCGGNAVVTVVGLSGMGKTRLVSEFVGRAREADIEGPWFCDLSTVTHGEALPSAVARAIGVERADVTAIADALGNRRGWLVLDSVEEITGDVAALLTLLHQRCPRLTTFVTGLAPLNIAGEVVIGLGPLPSGCATSPATELFLGAVRAPTSGGASSLVDRDVAVTIAQTLDGMPLAIELAAGYVQHLPAVEVAALLQARPGMPQIGAVPARRHHQTLLEAVRWSVEALPAAERSLLETASIFAAGFTAAALAGVHVDLWGHPSPPVRPSLAALQRRALLQHDDRLGPDRRYRLLDGIRSVLAMDRPARRTADLQDAHARWAVRLATRADAGMRTDDGGHWWQRLPQEGANLRAAIEHGMNGGDPVEALETAGRLTWYWYRRGEMTVGLSLLQRTLRAAPEAPVPSRMRGLLGVALLSYLAGDLPTFDRAAEAVLALADRADADPVALIQIRTAAAYVAALRGDLHRASALLTAGEPAGPEWLRAETLMAEGFLATAGGQPQRALERLAASAATAASVGHRWVEGSSSWIAAKILIDRGDGAAAIATLQPVLRHFARTGERTGPLAAIHTLATAYALAGDPVRGATLLAAVDEIGGQIGYHPLHMDPLDAPRHRVLVTTNLDADGWDQARTAGAALSYEELLALVIG